MKISGKNAVCEGVPPFKCRGEVSVDGNSGMVVSRNFFHGDSPPQRKKKQNKTEKKNRKQKNKATKFGPGNFTTVELWCTFRELMSLSVLPF